MKKRILTLALVLSLLVALVIPASVALAQSGSGGSVVTGTLSPVWTYTISPPGATTFPTAFTGTGAFTSLDAPVTVSTTDPVMVNCGITADDITGGTGAGYLTLGGTGALVDALDTELFVKGGDITVFVDAATNGLATAGPLVLRAASTTIASADMADFAVEQTITTGDLSKTAGAYSLTITFTATFN